MQSAIVKRSISVKQQEDHGLLINSGLKTSLSKIPLLTDNLFQGYKMNKIVNKILLARDKFMMQMHLGQPEFTYSACRLFIKSKE